ALSDVLGAGPSGGMTLPGGPFLPPFGANMFSYYGSKSKLVHLYPEPRYDHIIEPFAGSARYALRYCDRQVTLVDACPKICAIWRWLINASIDDVSALPELPQGADLRDYDFPDPVR